MKTIDRSRASIKKTGFQFVPFRPVESRHLRDLQLAPNVELIVFSRNGESRGLIAREMAYHHVCQGELAGEPFLVSF